MANYVCTKCGETADSKCAASRSVFPTDERATMWANVTTLEANRMLPKPGQEAYFPSDNWTLTMSQTHLVSQSEDELIDNFVQWITTQKPEFLKKVFCRHHWRLTADTCELGCCKRES